ncbi:MAG: cysteine peptidase family C39 domain-containing protein [Prosthecobacter sp.]
MNPNLTGLAAVTAALLVFVAGYQMAVKWGLRRRLCAALVLLLLSLPALGFTAYYAHVLPETAWFYELRSWRGSEFWVVFLGAFMAVVASLCPKVLRSLWFVLLGCMAIIPYVKPLLAPLPAADLHDQWSGNACLQSSSSTCGPASVATIVRQLGGSVTEREAALASYSYMGGTEAWYLARFIRSKGLAVRFEFRDGFDPGIPFPAVAGVRVGTGGHFIAVLARAGDDYVIADPLYGEKRCPVGELKQRYDFTGFYLVIAKR